MVLIHMCDLPGLYVDAQVDLEGTLGMTRMSSTRLAPCRSSAFSIGSMSLTSTRLLIVSFFSQILNWVCAVGVCKFDIYQSPGEQSQFCNFGFVVKLTELGIQFLFLI